MASHRSKILTFKVQTRLAELVDRSLQSGHLRKYKSRNAFFNGLLFYCFLFPKDHDFTPPIFRLKEDKQDIIIDFVIYCYDNQIDLRPHLPKPPTFKSLLEIADSWHAAHLKGNEWRPVKAQSARKPKKKAKRKDVKKRK